MASLSEYLNQQSQPSQFSPSPTNTKIPSLYGLLSQQSILTPGRRTEINTNAPLMLSGNASNTTIDTSTFPALIPDFSNTNVQSNTILAQIAQIQKQIDAARQAGYGENEQIKTDTQGDVASKEGGVFDKILNTFQAGQQQIQNLPQVPSLEDTTNRILSTFGFTPESFKQVSSLTTELAAVTDQINKLETSRQNEIARIEGRTGMTQLGFGAEEGRINREYSIRQAGLGARAATLNAHINTLTGAYDKANEAAFEYVAFKTQEKRQQVADIQYATEFYKDIFLAMDASERDRINKLLDFQASSLKAESDDYWKEMNYNLDLWKAEQGAMGGGGTEDAQQQYIAERATMGIDTVDDLLSRVSNFKTVGFGGGLTKFIPGTPAANFAADLDQLESVISTTQLQQMRNASKTGGALGQVAVRELEILSATLGSLKQTQSAANMTKNLNKVRESLVRWANAVNQYGGGSGSQVAGSTIVNTSAGPVNVGWGN